jgi:hypothetical protein
MKKCPSCGRTYTDPALNFCLQDGTVLEQEMVSTFGNEETVVIGQTPSTNPGGSPYSSSPNNPPPTWQASPYAVAHPQPRKRKSRAWLWILLSFFAICLFGVVGFAGFLVYLGMKIDQESKNKDRVTANNINKGKWNGSNKPDKDTSGVKKVDFSGWTTGTFGYGKVEYKDNQLIVTSTKADTFTVITTGKSFLTNDGITRLTVKNPSKGESKLGFGVVVNANSAKPFTKDYKDYAFLIRTGDKPGYRIVRHLASVETDVVAWVPSTAIDGGDDDNELEVRDEGSKLSFYINDDFVTSIDDEYGTANSVAGIYAGDSIPIVFSGLETEHK